MARTLVFIVDDVELALYTLKPEGIHHIKKRVIMSVCDTGLYSLYLCSVVTSLFEIKLEDISNGEYTQIHI